MFNRYWREYPWAFQLLQYIIFIFVFLSLFGGVLAPLVALRIKDDWWSSVIAQGIGHLGIFTVPAVLFAYLTHPQAAGYLGIRKPGKSYHWVLVLVATLGAIPLILALGGLMRQFDLGPAANRMHEETEAMMRKVMDLSSTGRLAIAIVVMAILPAVGEELMFRGVLMRFAARRARTPFFPILITAIIFAIFHFSNPYALFPIFLMGVVLALIYYWTRSLLCSMLAHFLFNGAQIILHYLASGNAAMKDFLDKESVPTPWLVASLLPFLTGAILLWKTRTPLRQPGWAADFSPEELAAREEANQPRL